MTTLVRRMTPVLLLLLIALLVRLGVACWWQSRVEPPAKFHFPDSESYWSLGHTIARGDAYRFGDEQVFRSPGYPLVLAGLFTIVGEDPPVVWARALGVLLGTFAVGGVFWLTALLFDRKTALLAGVAAAVQPGAVVMSPLVLAEATFCAVMLLQLVVWTKAWRGDRQADSLAWAVLAGLIAGVATLIRPSWLLFTPLAIAVGLITDRRRRRQALLAPCLLAGLVIAMSPWWVRNWAVTGRFVPTTLQVGASLYDGLNPQANGASDMQFVGEYRLRLQLDDAAGVTTSSDTFEYRLDRRLRQDALTWPRANPGRVLQLAGIKFVRLWNLWPNEASLRGWPIRLVVLSGYLPILVCGLLGARKFWSAGWPYALCVLPAVYFSLLHMVFVSSIRYRQPAMLLLLVLAAGWAVDKFRNRQVSTGGKR